MGFPMTRRIDAAGLVIAFILLALAGAIWWDMSSLQISSTYGLGPKAMPMIVAAGLAILAAGNAIMAFRGDLPARDSLDWKPIILILGIGTCALGSPERSANAKVLSALGILALGLGALALITGSLTALSLLVLDIVVLWAASTLGHVRHPQQTPIAT